MSRSIEGTCCLPQFDCNYNCEDWILILSSFFLSSFKATMSGESYISVKFELGDVEHNEGGWGPVGLPSDLSDLPYAPFSKGDKLGRVADWTGQLSAARGINDTILQLAFSVMWALKIFLFLLFFFLLFFLLSFLPSSFLCLQLSVCTTLGCRTKPLASFRRITHSSWLTTPRRSPLLLGSTGTWLVTVSVLASPHFFHA